MIVSRILLAGVLTLGLGIAIGWWMARDWTNDRPPEESTEAASDVLYWYDPMRPEVHFDKPGPSPFMDMALVPKYGTGKDGGGISISPRVTQNLGVRTAPVRAVEIAPRMTVTGSVAIDERSRVTVSTRAAGWLERLDVRAAGDAVRRGQRVAGLYSPDLLAAQEEFLLALRTDDAALLPAARRRLALLGIGSGQVQRIASRGAPERQIEILAPIDGVVTELPVQEGVALSTGMPVVTLADLSQVWVFAEVPESQGAWLQVGQIVEIGLADPRADLTQGRVDYLYPELSPATRTIRVRILVPNDKFALRPGMTTRVTIAGEPRNALVIPTEALIRSGMRSAVILADGDGQFRPVAVESGVEQGDQTEILEGLKAGEKVVVSGQFLIDSEANLRGALERLLPGEGR